MSDSEAERPDYYAALGVSKTASAALITQAYRKLVVHCHPDLHPGDELALQKFKAITEAYEVLNDPQRKAGYDQYGRLRDQAESAAESAARKAAEQSPSRVNHGSSFTDLFGARPQSNHANPTAPGSFGGIFGKKKP